MIKSNFASGLEVLLQEKNITVEEKRCGLATHAALELIAVAIGKDGSTHSLSDEFSNLPKYSDAIYAALSNGRSE